MSRYGINFYGPGTYYGETPLIEFDARPMTAVSRNYGEMSINWTTPSGSWDLMRLTRDSFGFAPRADMGTLLFESPKAGAPTSYPDTEGLTQGKFYYYTIWVRSTVDDQWRRAGDVIGLVTQDWGYRNRMYELLPGFYREKDRDTPKYRLYGRGDLERFLEIPGYEADHIRTELESLKWVNDPDKVSGGLLPLMAKQLGFGYEGELGMRLARQQMRNAVRIYKTKGTQLGVEALASVLTDWPPTVRLGHNIVLDQNDSSWEQPNRVTVTATTTNGSAVVTASSPTFSAADVGRTVSHPNLPAYATIITYTSTTQVTVSANATATGAGTLTVIRPSSQWVNNTNATLALRSTADTSAPGAVAGPVDPPPGASTGDVGSGEWMLLLRAVGAGDMVIQSFAAGTSIDNRTKGIPVTAGAVVTLSIYSYALDVVRSVRLGVEWFNVAGTSLGAVTESTATANLTTAWTRHTHTVIAPAGAAFARVTVRVVGAAAGNRILFDAFQFEASVSSDNLLSPNQASIETDPSGWGVPTNIAQGALYQAGPNMLTLNQASVEVDTTGFQAGGNTTIARSTAMADHGIASLACTAVAAGNIVARTAAGTGAVPITPGVQYTAAVRFRAAATPRTVQANIVYYSITGSWISTHASTTTTDTTTGWTLRTATATAPAAPTAAAFAAVEWQITGCAAGEVHHVDRLGLWVGTGALPWTVPGPALDGVASLALTAAASGTMSVKNTPTSGVGAIAATVGQTFMVTAAFRGATTGRSVQVAINFRDASGGALTTVTGTAVTSTTTGWTTATVLGTATHASTAYLTAELIVTGTTGAGGETHYVDSIFVTQTLRPYQSARSIRIAFRADRVNLVHNPSFEVNLTGWTEFDGSANNSLTPTRDTTRFHDGAASLKLVNTAAGNDDFMEIVIPAQRIVPLTKYTISAWLYVETLTAGANGNRGVFVYDYILGGFGAAVSTLTTGHTVGEWVRHSVVWTSSASPGNVGIRLYAPHGTVYWDSVLMEQGVVLKDYFDGTSQTTEGEYLWEAGGTPATVPSYYYSRRLIKNFRMNQRLPEFLPAGSSYALLYAGAT